MPNVGIFCVFVGWGQWQRFNLDPIHRCPLGALRRQVVAFIWGSDLAALPELKYYADAFMFLPHLEINVERLHAQIAQRIAITHNHAPSYISIQVRKNEIMRSHAADCDVLAECCELAPDRRKAVHELGLINHPAFAEYRHGAALHCTVPHSCVNQVFGCTPQSSDSRLPDGWVDYRRISTHYPHCGTCLVMLLVRYVCQ